MPRIKNTKKKYAAENDNYVFCWGTVGGDRVALMLTDAEYKRARKRADKNKEDFPVNKSFLSMLFGWVNN